MSAVAVPAPSPMEGDAGLAERIEQAAREYLARRDRLSHPDGTFDKQGRFYLAARERCPCCQRIRTPSARWPYSEMLHGRTAGHVAALYGVDATDLRRAARALGGSA